MTEIFRERTIESPVEPQKAPQSTQNDYKSDVLSGAETKLQDPATEEEKKIEIWEGLNRTKFINDYFNIKAYEGEFNLKMQTSQIDKYIKGELDKRGWDKSVDNWSKIMGEIEGEIGSKELEVFKRITKITSYVKILNKLYAAKQLKDKYLTSFMSS